MTENDENQDDLVSVLEDIRRWVKIIGLQEAIPVLNEVLFDENDEDRDRALKIVYHLTDGTNSNDDIAQYIDYSSEFVRRRQNEWADLGLLERDKANQPYSHVISLEQAGIEVPDISNPNNDEMDDSEDESSNGQPESEREEGGDDDGEEVSDEERPLTAWDN